MTTGKMTSLRYGGETMFVLLLLAMCYFVFGSNNGKLMYEEIIFLGPLLLTWFNFNPTMDK